MQEVQGMDSKVYGYIRVSTREQNIERQMISLLDAGVNQKDIYIDKQSGKNFQRPAYKKMMRRVRELSGNHGAMAHYHERKEGGHLYSGYAFIGHNQDKGSAWHLH